MEIDALDETRIEGLSPLQFNSTIHVDEMDPQEADLIRRTSTQALDALNNYKSAVERLEFPNLAWEAVKAGLRKEHSLETRINTHIDAIQTSHDDIALLLDLQSALSKKEEVSEQARILLDKLEARGIHLQGDNAEEIKRLASSHESKLRSDVQIQFTTKVQYLMQQIESLNQILQNIIRSDQKLKEKANQLPR